MSKIQFEQIHEDVVEITIPSNTPIDMVQQLTKSLTARGLVEDIKNSTLGVRYFVRPETDSVTAAADKLIKSLEKLTKDDGEMPYWHPKAQMAHQKKLREQAIAERRAKIGIKQPTNVSPAPEPHTMPDSSAPAAPAAPAAPKTTAPSFPKMYDNTPQAMNTAGGTGRRYGTIPDPVTKGDDEDGIEKSGYGPKGAGQYSAADNAKRKANNIGDSTGVGPNNNVKAYSTKPGQMSGKAQAGLTARIQQAANKKQPVKQYSPEEIKAFEASRVKKSAWADHNPIPSAEEEIMRLAKGVVQDGETAAANQLASLLQGKNMLGEKAHPAIAAMMAPPPPQPTDQQMFGHLAVSDEMAKNAEKQWSGTLNNWLVEASKPISQRFASQAEEDAYWAKIRIEDRDDGKSGH